MADGKKYYDDKYRIIEKVENASNFKFPIEYDSNLEKFSNKFLGKGNKTKGFLFLSAYGIKNNLYNDFKSKENNKEIYRANTGGPELRNGLGSFLVCNAYHYFLNVDKSIKKFEDIFEKKPEDIVYVSTISAIGALDYIFDEIGWTESRDIPKELYDELESDD